MPHSHTVVLPEGPLRLHGAAASTMPIGLDLDLDLVMLNQG